MTIDIRPEHDIVCGKGGCRADYRPYKNKPVKTSFGGGTEITKCCQARIIKQRKKNPKDICEKCMKLV